MLFIWEFHENAVHSFENFTRIENFMRMPLIWELSFENFTRTLMWEFHENSHWEFHENSHLRILRTLIWEFHETHLRISRELIWEFHENAAHLRKRMVLIWEREYAHFTRFRECPVQEGWWQVSDLSESCSLRPRDSSKLCAQEPYYWALRHNNSGWLQMEVYLLPMAVLAATLEYPYVPPLGVCQVAATNPIGPKNTAKDLSNFDRTKKIQRGS